MTATYAGSNNQNVATLESISAAILPAVEDAVWEPFLPFDDAGDSRDVGHGEPSRGNNDSIEMLFSIFSARYSREDKVVLASSHHDSS